MPRRLTGLAREVAEGYPDLLGELAGALHRSADPEMSLLRLLDVPREERDWIGGDGARGVRRFVEVAAQSGLYGRWVAREPRLLFERERALRSCGDEIAACLGVDESTLRGGEHEGRFRHAIRMRRRLRSLAVVEADALDARPLEETAALLSRAACEAIQDVWRWVERLHDVEDQRVCVLAMGKLGGGELNFSSDIDVIFVSDPPGEGKPEALRKAVQQFGEILEERVEPGPVYRVDLRLRPFGTQGPLVHSVGQMLAYYEQHGRTWERGALIRASAVGGCPETGDRLLRGLRPFVYRRYLDESAIGEIAAMKHAVDAQARARRAGRPEPFDVKLGMGGIREIEFFVQSFQLVWGGRHPELRERHTLAALRRLAEFGLVPERSRAELTDAWRFLRVVEHRLQMDEERQTQRLPADRPGLDRLARRLGLEDGAALESALEEHRRAVRRCWDRLFAADASSALEATAWVAAAVDGLSEQTVTARVEAMAALGFAHPARTLKDLERLAKPPDALIGRFAPGPTRRAVEPLLAASLESALPDRAIERSVGMLSRRGSRAVVLEVLRARPRAATVLASFFGSAGELGALIAREPVVLEEILAGGDGGLRNTEALRAAFREALDVLDQRLGGPSRERRLVWLRRLRAVEELRVALGELSGRFGVGEITRGLSQLAEVCLECTRSEALDELAGRLPEGAEERFGALALGKLGAGELGHGGDLDLVFVFDDEPSESGRYARLAQRWIAYLSTPMAWGRCFAVDMRLRPDGSQGAVVTTLEGLRRYYAERAWPWEVLALVRGRPVACGERLGGALEQIVDDVLGAADVAAVGAEVARLRGERLREQRERGGPLDIKAMPGGLMDLEHLVHVGWLGARERVTRQWGHVGALVAALGDADVLSKRDAGRLQEAHRLYRSVELRLRLSEGADVSRLPSETRRADALARWVLDRADATRLDLEEILRETAEEVCRIRARTPALAGDGVEDLA